MSGALADCLSYLDRRVDEFSRTSLALCTRAMGGGDVSATTMGATAYGLAGSNDSFGNVAIAGQYIRLYRAAMRDHQYTSIRPLAVKVAEQSLKIARKRTTTSPPDRLITKSADHPPYIVKAIEADGLEPIEGHWLDDLFEDPNPHMTRWALLFCIAFSMEACGEAILWVDIDESGGRSVWYMPRHWVRPIAQDGDPYAFWKLTIPNVSQDLPPIPGRDIIRISYPSPADTTASLSPTAAQSRAINTDDHIQDAQLASMKNAIRPTVAIEIGEVMPVPGSDRMTRPELTPEQRKDIIEAIRLAYRGSMHYGDPIVLDALIAGIHQVFPNAAELDFPNGSQLTRDRIMEGYGTNPIVVGRIEGANRASAFVAHEGFYDIKVNPLLELIGQTLTKWARKNEAMLGGRLYLWFTKPQARDADLQLRQLQAGVAANLVRPSEFRESLGLKPDPEIEQWWVERQRAGVKAAQMAATPPPAPGLPAPESGGTGDQPPDEPTGQTARRKPKPLQPNAKQKPPARRTTSRV